MKSPQEFPSFDDVCSDIGDKVVSAMFASIQDARRDLSTYRQTLPLFVAEHTERGLANWIHDRMWASVSQSLSDHPEVTIFDNGVLREIHCGINYRFRAKRHDEDSNTRSYPTQGVLDFHAQPITFDGLSELCLDFGYQWDPETRDIGPAVMSLRQGTTLIWNNVIPGDEATSTIGINAPTPGIIPPSVTIGIPNRAEKAAETQ